MQKFRAHKGKIISSKRDSQKLDELQLFSYSHSHQPDNTNVSLVRLLREQMHTITEKHYKIEGQRHNHLQIINKKKHTDKVPTGNKQHPPKHTIKSNAPFQHPFQNTYDSDQPFDETSSHSNIVQKQQLLQDLLGKTLQLMSTLNLLQQKKSLSSVDQDDQLSIQIKSKLTEFKQLLSCIQNKSENSMLDFYNQENDLPHSPTSFNSRNSDESPYQPATDRQAYEMTDHREPDTQLQLKYRRVNASSGSAQLSSDTFADDIEQDRTPEKYYQQNKQNEINQSSIIHLFSYEREKCLDSPLPSITEHSSQYCSPDSKTTADPLFSQSLQYKKIYYLLQTSEKKKEGLQTSEKKKEGSTATNRHEVSEFAVEGKTNRESNKSFVAEAIDRSRCHSQLIDMIHLLETKYKRKVKAGAQNIMDSLNAALSSKAIRPRGRK